MDEIFIKDLVVNAILGVNDWEREQPQNILINITMFTDIHLTAESDQIKNGVDYGVMTRGIQNLVVKATRFTVEALAQDIASFCLSNEMVTRVRVRVEKPGAIAGVSSVGVQIER